MLRGNGEHPLDARRLLAIDVDAEVRKLAEAQLEGVWQLPVELVRAVVRAGARHAQVRIRGSGLTVEADGPGLPPGLLRHLATLRLPGASAAARHRALVSLEREGALALIVLAGLKAEQADIDRTGNRIDVRGLRLPAERVRRFLEGACRFAPGTLTIDGRPAPRGFDRALAEAELAAPLSGRLAIPAQGEAARVWLLLDGVAAAHVTVPGGLCFEAALEMRNGVAPLPGAAALREAAAPHIPALEGQAHRLLVALGGRIRGRSDGEQSRIRQLLLTAARDRERAAGVFPLPAFRAVMGTRAEELWLSLRDIEGLGAELGTVPALDPGQEPSAFLLPAAPVLVLDTPERSRLGALLGLRFMPPPRRPARSSLRQWLASALEPAAVEVGALAQRVLYPRRREVVSLERLTPAERALLAALRSPIGPGRGPDAVAIVEGDGSVRRTRGPRWWLPRANALVVACRDAVARDAAWAYPARFALLEGAEPAPEGVRSLWWNRKPAVQPPASGAGADGRR